MKTTSKRMAGTGVIVGGLSLIIFGIASRMHTMEWTNYLGLVGLFGITGLMLWRTWR